MNDYQPKVGDRVMVGEHGPYEVRVVDERHKPWAYLRVPPSSGLIPVLRTWLTPAPDPEPDEPTAPGALVRDGEGVLWARDATSVRPWVNLDGEADSNWPNIPRPITVILADPAEAETLRAERDDALRRERVAQENAESRLQSAMKATDRADELQRRIDVALNHYYLGNGVQRVADILRGES